MGLKTRFQPIRAGVEMSRASLKTVLSMLRSIRPGNLLKMVTREKWPVLKKQMTTTTTACRTRVTSVRKLTIQQMTTKMVYLMRAMCVRSEMTA